MNELIINGEKYLKEVNPSQVKMVRSYAAGVFYGEIISEKHEVSGLVVEMKNARRVWYWSGACSLSQLSINGTIKPSDCKFPEAVPYVKLMNVVEILDITDQALISLNGVKIWKQ
jgi:hypothetical protein